MSYFHIEDVVADPDKTPKPLPSTLLNLYDHSEFPTLSGAPQAQYPNPGQAIWANANQRANQNVPVQRPQQPTPSNVSNSQSQPQSSAASDTHHSSLDGAYFSNQFGASLDDFHRGNSALSGGPLNHQPPSTSIDDFPPLGRNSHGDIGSGIGPHRDNVLQGSFSNSAGFGSQMPSHLQNRQSNALHAPGFDNRTVSPAAPGLGPPQPSRSPGDAFSQGGYNGMGDSKLDPIARPLGLNGNGSNNDDSILSNLISNSMSLKPESTNNNMGNNSFGAPGSGKPSTNQGQVLQQSFPDTFGHAELVESPNGNGPSSHDQTPLHQMSELDRFGLAGLLHIVKNENSDIAALAIGQDLQALGLDLNSSEPLWPTFGGPFAAGPVRPLPPKYTLPACYSVTNVHPIEEKISSFSDETLFWMFHSMPRDVMQEVAATELVHRNWRYHKVMKQWLTKDMQFENPTAVSNEAERGRYIVFSVPAWQRESRDMILYWRDLDDHIQRGQPVASGGLA
ncbi:hypothetical protein MMC25_006788 [Agyrium rufum]|nr:hypothetical protein [Agyrium rufum]